MDWSGPIGSAILAVVGALLGAIALDIYVHIKNGSKKIIDKKKQESKQELADSVTAVLTPALEPIKRDIDELKASVDNIANTDIPQLKDASRDSLRNQLLAVYRHCANLEYRTEEDSENFEYMFESYTGLGGNSFIVSLHEAFRDLPIKRSGDINKK